MAALRRAPYGHDIEAMWLKHTRLFAEAMTITEEFQAAPSPLGVNDTFDWELHFTVLARAHSSVSDYSVRYHNGVRSFADPIALTVVLGTIWNNETTKPATEGIR